MTSQTRLCCVMVSPVNQSVNRASCCSNDNAAIAAVATATRSIASGGSSLILRKPSGTGALALDTSRSIGFAS